LGIYENNLIALLKGGIFIGLDVETGILNWKKDNIDENKTNLTFENGFGLGGPYNVYLDISKGKLFYFLATYFVSIDLKTKIANYEWSPYDKYGFGSLSINNSLYYDKWFYFSAVRKENPGNADTIGVFDIDKNEIIWLHTFDFPKGVFIRELKVSENRIYVLDSTHTLQVMKRI
jgi:hypothetical protein